MEVLLGRCVDEKKDNIDSFDEGKGRKALRGKGNSFKQNVLN